MKKNKNIIWYILIIAFGLIFVPLILNRLKSNDIVRSESRSLKVDNFENNTIPLSFLIINDKKKKVPQFNFRNQNGRLISNKDYLGKVYVIEFFFTTCTTICPIMTNNLVHVQNSFTSFPEFG